ncbi:hypothetical protein [Aliiglaciecola sp. M165]|uniref:hypothetical protein n=1 Tax=Aliiglaciecola sp. M165 TaxID=2593649 RepID=UPI00117E2DF6|nr:hypothetical protein [Aliiglaciecola sp. M165]TRY31044.1 hypothetical protein FM019_14320 [Aliiglaciecola sp. M165]
MNFEHFIQPFITSEELALSTMMGTSCLRFKGEFVSMYFAKEESLIVKLSPNRVNELIENGEGYEFNYTKKRFKEWVLIPLDFEESFGGYVDEAIDYAKLKVD